MSRAYKCDGCEEFVEGEPHSDYTTTKENDYGQRVHRAKSFELCEDCTDRVKSMLDGEGRSYD